MHNKRGNSIVLDIGTTGIKAFVFDHHFETLSRAYEVIGKTSKRNGWVEQDPREILAVSRRVLRKAVRESGQSRRSFIGMGITNQRETTVLWSKRSGALAYPAIVWEDRRTFSYCEALKKRWNTFVERKTGLPLNPYFSASKIHWILKNVQSARALRDAGDLLFGTIDAWVMWNFLAGRPHITDYTNASRTLLFNIKTLQFDPTLLTIFEVPREMLPRVAPSASFFGMMKPDILGFTVPVLAVAGDQQASLFAAGSRAGTTKVTYGTGAFVSQIIGKTFRLRKPFFTTLAASASHRPNYVLEAKVNDCGARVSAVLSNPRKLRAVLREIAKEVGQYLRKLPKRPRMVIIDGGATRNDSLAKLQEESAGVSVIRQKAYDGTALGAAMLVARAAKKIQ